MTERIPTRPTRRPVAERPHLSRYVQWAETHNSLLIVAWDEDDGKSDNHIPMIVVGPMVAAGRYDERTDHYGLVRTITDMYGAQPIGLSRQGRPIISIWDAPSQNASRNIHVLSHCPDAFHNFMLDSAEVPSRANKHQRPQRAPD